MRGGGGEKYRRRFFSLSPLLILAVSYSVLFLLLPSSFTRLVWFQLSRNGRLANSYGVKLYPEPRATA